MIITHDDYYSALLPLVQWKTQKGIKSKIVKLSSIGNDSTQIKNYVVNAYNTWQIQPEYLLLVGNKNQIPFVQYNYQGYISYSDNYYSNVAGDFHNEIIPGRLWVFDTLQAKTIVAKILGYEKLPYLNDSLWFRKGVTIVNEDQDSMPADSVYWADARYAHVLMNNAGFTHIDSFARSFGDSSLDVINAINDGRSYILYRGVGIGNWDYPFNNIDIGQMNNGYELPIVISATCPTVEGIGYWWLNAGTPLQPKGTAGFLGTTSVLEHAAEFRSALAKGTLENIFCDSMSTLGKAAEAGRLEYYELFGNTLEYNSWTCLGDPEMTVWTSTPKQINVSYDTVIMASVYGCTINVNVQHNSVPVESSLVCVYATQDTSVYQYDRTDILGDVVFIDTFNTPGDSLLITVTGRNLKPYCGIAKVNFFRPYVLLSSFSISDSIGGNGDSIVNPGEDIEIPVWVKNWGDSTAYNVYGIVREEINDSFTVLYDTVKSFGDIAGYDSAFTSANGYNVTITNSCLDTHEIMLNLVIKDVNDSTWISPFKFTVHAPIILFERYYFPGFLKYTPAGDTNQLIIELTNVGSYMAENATARIFSSDSFLIPIDSTSSFGTIQPDSTVTNQADPFIITTSPQTPLCYPLDAKLEFISGVYVDTFDVTIYVGQREYLIWDPDPNHSSGPIIKTMLDSLDFNGVYSTNMIPYNDYLSLYKALFICCGVYPNNYVIKDTSRAGQEIDRYLSVLGGKSYLEGGDVWYGDPHNTHGYFFHPLFHINPLTNSVGPLTHVSGESGTFTQSMAFGYSGENNSIDRINPDSGGMLIFKKTANNFNCGVASNNKTVGISYELGGLDDSVPPSTKLTLVDSIMQYFGIPPTGIAEFDMHQLLVASSARIYPNPARQKVIMEFVGFSGEDINMKIYDVSGRLVRDFRMTLDALHTTQITWDGSNEHGDKLPSGVYFLKIDAEDYTETKKFILLR